MARGRMVNQSISRSLKFDSLPDDTCRLLATWLIPQLDKNGVFYGDPTLVKSLILPRRNDITAEKVDHYLQCMIEHGLIVMFEANGQWWQWWPGFVENQVGLRSERESTDFPKPPKGNAGNDIPNGNVPDLPPDDGEPEESRNVTGTLPEESPPKFKEKFKKKFKEKGREFKRPASVHVYEQVASLTPHKSLWVKMDEIIGDNEKSLILFRRVVEAWIGMGWNPRILRAF